MITYKEIAKLIENRFDYIRCTVVPFAEESEGCWIDFKIKNNLEYPRTVCGVYNDKGRLSFDVSSIWHGPESGGSRFGNPKVYHNIEDLLFRIEQMYNEFIKK